MLVRWVVTDCLLQSLAHCFPIGRCAWRCGGNQGGRGSSLGGPGGPKLSLRNIILGGVEGHETEVVVVLVVVYRHISATMA